MSDSEAKPTVDHLLVEMTIAAPVEAVWDALKDPAKIYNWHGWDDPTLKDEVDFIYGQYGNYDDEAKVLSFGEYEGVAYRFEAKASGDGTVLRVIGAASADKRWDGVYEDVVEGWISFAQQLRFGLERHDIGPRRTIYLNGRAKEDRSSPIEALGIAELRGKWPGERVAVDLATGEHVEGELWHHNQWQVGLTVPQWGDGLLIATDKSVTDKAPHGRGMVILTTYGLADEDFAALETRWRGWWTAHFEEVPAMEQPAT